MTVSKELLQALKDNEDFIYENPGKIKDDKKKYNQVVAKADRFLDTLGKIAHTKNPEYIPYLIKYFDDDGYDWISYLNQMVIGLIFKNEKGYKIFTENLEDLFKKAPNYSADIISSLNYKEEDQETFKKYMHLIPKDSWKKILDHMNIYYPADEYPEEKSLIDDLRRNVGLL